MLLGATPTFYRRKNAIDDLCEEDMRGYGFFCTGMEYGLEGGCGAMSASAGDGVGKWTMAKNLQY